MRKNLVLLLAIGLLPCRAICQENFWTQVGIRSLQYKLRSLEDSERVDCLNLLVRKISSLDISWAATIDTMTELSLEANNLAKKIGYKKGLGYSYLRLAENVEDRNEYLEILTKKHNNGLFHREEQHVRAAIQIGEEINDYYLLGHAYWQLASLATNKRDTQVYQKSIKKSIYYFKNGAGRIKKGEYQEESFTDCSDCEGNELWLAGIYRMQANVAHWFGRFDKAINFIDTAISYATIAGNKQFLAGAYWGLMSLSFKALDYKTSIEAAKKLISLNLELGNEGVALQALTEVCKIYDINGRFEEGLSYGKQSIELAEKLRKNNSKNQFRGNAFFWMSRLYKMAGDYESALSWIRRAKDHYPEKMRDVNKELWESEMGDVHRRMGNIDSAKFYLFPFKNKTEQHNFGHVALGYLYLALHEYDSALKLANPLIDLYYQRKRLVPPLANSLIIASTASLNKGLYKDALGYARKGIDCMQAMDGRVLLIDGYKLLSAIFLKLGRTDSSFVYLNKYTILKDSLINRQFYWNLNNYKKEAEDASKETAINLQSKDNELKNERLKQTRLLLLLGLIGIAILAVFIYRSLSMKRKNDKLIFEKAQSQLQHKASELEMQALRAQMNPHFIFNCLSSINRFILKNETEAASDYLTKFSRLIRMVLIHSQSPEVLLKDEIEMLRLYLDMEQLRFKNTFDYSINFTNSIDPEIIFIPPLLLQPFCENAIWHGLMHKKGQGWLEIKLAMNGDHLHCTISDNGIGRKKAAEIKSRSGEMHKSVGLKITVERLSLMNKENSSRTSYHAEDILNELGNVSGTRVVLNINCKDKDKEPAKEFTT